MNRVSSDFLDQIRERVPLSTIASRRLQWSKAKTNARKGDFWACCPLHSERSPSFHADDRKGRWHCFGCGESGDVISFLTKVEGRTFPEAVESLAQEAGIQLQPSTPESRQAAARKLTLIGANDQASDFFQTALRQSPAAMAYAASRGLTGAVLDQFRIGYAPEGNGLLRAFGEDSVAIEAGLIRKGEDGRASDWFRHRLMFPIIGDKDRVIGFSGRAMGQIEPKYLNTPASPIFDKGSILYNGPSARKAAWDGKRTVIVEGNVDAISCSTAGYASAAPMGTAMTEAHVRLIWKMSDEPVICFDGDAAGAKAANRTIDLALPSVSPGFSVRFALMPPGRDPDDIVRHKPDSFAKIIDGSISLADMLWKRETMGVFDTPEKVAALRQALRSAIAKIADKETRAAYGADFKDRLDAFGSRPKVYRSNGWSNHSTSPSAGRLMYGFHRSAMLSLREAILIGAVASAPHAAMDRAEEIAADERLSKDARSLLDSLIEVISSAPEATAEELCAAIETAGIGGSIKEAIDLAKSTGMGGLIIGTEPQEAVGILHDLRRH